MSGVVDLGGHEAVVLRRNFLRDRNLETNEFGNPSPIGKATVAIGL